jgi:hypothetical protein
VAQKEKTPINQLLEKMIKEYATRKGIVKTR